MGLVSEDGVGAIAVGEGFAARFGADTFFMAPSPRAAHPDESRDERKREIEAVGRIRRNWNKRVHRLKLTLPPPLPDPKYYLVKAVLSLTRVS